MREPLCPTTRALMDERFGRDQEIALATVDEDGEPWVRTVNAYYTDGAFYVITSARSNKMRQIEENSSAALCGDWFTGKGVGENLGHILAPENAAIREKLRAAFAAWYSNGHINEANPATVILRITLTSGMLAHHGTWYDIDFT